MSHVQWLIDSARRVELKERIQAGKFFGKEGAIVAAKKEITRIAAKKDVERETVVARADLCLATVYLMAHDHINAEIRRARFPYMRLWARARAQWYFMLSRRMVRRFESRVGTHQLPFGHLILRCEQATKIGDVAFAYRYYELTIPLLKRLTLAQSIERRIVYAEMCIAERNYKDAHETYMDIGTDLKEQRLVESLEPEHLARFYYSCARFDQLLMRKHRQKKKNLPKRNHLTMTAFGLGHSLSEEHHLGHYKLLFDAIYG